MAIAAETLRTVSGLVADFLAGHPDVSFRLCQPPAPLMSAQLQAGEVDLYLASQPLSGPALRSVELISEEVLLAVPPSHNLARHTHAEVSALAGEPFVTTRPGYWQRALTDRIFAGSGTEPVIVCEGDEPYAIRGLISAGVGIGLMPTMARRLAPDPPVSWLRLDAPDCRRTLSLVWRADAYLPTAAWALADFAVGYFRTWHGDTWPTSPGLSWL